MTKINVTEDKTVNHGVNFLEMLFLLFLGLKLAGKINWSWWWVFAPIWAPVAILLLFFVVVLVVTIIVNLFKEKDED